MQIDSIADLKLTARALSAGWLDGFEEKRQAAVAALFKIVETSEDPEMKMKAFEALVRADQADLKRAEVSIKKQEADDNKRLRLLEILRHLPAGEISKLASGDTGATEG